jgi:inositol hexakisphosphate/diphosphoinositol-pentakisphosphate kinase
MSSHRSLRVRVLGINRKVQMKPLTVAPPEAGEAEPRVLELQLVVKHGGVLTHAGRAQAEALGSDFRRTIYPSAARYDDLEGDEGAGLLRLHSTYRHDLKLWSSDEGRVQMSAAAFAKGLLDLEGTSLAPILVSLVNLNGFMLDSFDKGASEDIRAAKAAMARYMTTDDKASAAAAAEAVAASAAALLLREDSGAPSLSASGSAGAAGDAWEGGAEPARSSRDSAPPVPPSPSRSIVPEVEALPDILPGQLGDAWTQPPVELLRALVVRIQALREEIQERIWAAHGISGSGAAGGGGGGGVSAAASAGGSTPGVSPSSSASGATPGGPCSDESLFLLLERWRKLERGLYNTRKGVFDISKIPDIFDAVKYDALHSRHWGLSGLPELHAIAKQLADVVIPNEYGISPDQKLRIGAKICSTLLGKILRDFTAVREESTAAWHDASLPRSGSMVAGAGGRMSQHAQPPLYEGTEGVGGGEENDDSGGDTDDDDGGYRLHAQYADDINSKSRHVRTRVYFTSESHMHALINVVRYAHLCDGAPPGADGADGAAAASAPPPPQQPPGAAPVSRRASGVGATAPLVSAAGEAALAGTRELDYLSTLVLLLYEVKDVPPSDPQKFRVELLFSPGAAGDPFAAPEGSHALPVAPRVPLWQPTEAGGGAGEAQHAPAGGAGEALTLNRVESALGAFAAGWRSKGCPELSGGGASSSGLHSRTPSGTGGASGARDSC